MFETGIPTDNTSGNHCLRGVLSVGSWWLTNQLKLKKNLKLHNERPLFISDMRRHGPTLRIILYISTARIKITERIKENMLNHHDSYLSISLLSEKGETISRRRTRG